MPAIEARCLHRGRRGRWRSRRGRNAPQPDDGSREVFAPLRGDRVVECFIQPARCQARLPWHRQRYDAVNPRNNEAQPTLGAGNPHPYFLPISERAERPFRRTGDRGSHATCTFRHRIGHRSARRPSLAPSNHRIRVPQRARAQGTILLAEHCVSSSQSVAIERFRPPHCGSTLSRASGHGVVTLAHLRAGAAGLLTNAGSAARRTRSVTRSRDGECGGLPAPGR
jgi:hypothetical protein